MLHCSAADAPQSTIGALGAVAHTFLFLTYFALRGRIAAISVTSYQVQSVVFFNMEMGRNIGPALGLEVIFLRKKQ